MKDCRHFYIDGKWVSPAKPRDFIVLNPATEQPIATISFGGAADVEKAVSAAERAFESYSETTVHERLALLERIIAVYRSKLNEMAETISLEMGAPLSLSTAAQAPAAAVQWIRCIVGSMGSLRGMGAVCWTCWMLKML